jgi:hypothetical protein
MIARAIAALVLVGTIGAAVPDKDAVTKALAGRVPGQAEDCITLSSNQGPQIVDAQTILYRQSGKRVWRTGPIGACPSLRPLETLVVEVWGGQLCRNDRFRVITPGLSIPSGYCRFDRFTPYDKP